MIKDLEYYLALDYDIIVSPIKEEDGGGFLAYYKDLPSVMGDGETREEAILDVQSAFKSFLVVSIENRDPIAEPNDSLKAKRINITIPANILNLIDNYAKEHHMSRSGFFQVASKRVLNLVGEK